MLPRFDLLAEARPDHPRGEEAEREVDEEDAAPEIELREHPAQGGAGDGRERPDAREVALHPGPFLKRVDVADHRDDDRQDGPGSDALHGAEHDEARHVPREPAEDRAQQEHSDPPQDERLAPERVGEFRVDRNGDRGGEQVDREEPRERGEAADVGDDRRQGGRDDSGVDRDESGREHHREKKGSALRPEADGSAHSP
jgi:hypothetical protein